MHSKLIGFRKSSNASAGTARLKSASGKTGLKACASVQCISCAFPCPQMPTVSHEIGEVRLSLQVSISILLLLLRSLLLLCNKCTQDILPMVLALAYYYCYYVHYYCYIINAHKTSYPWCSLAIRATGELALPGPWSRGCNGTLMVRKPNFEINPTS